jgi:large subunit ribosomal protein L23
VDARDIIVAPRITEKSMAGTAVQQYTFKVNPRATKTEIKSAVSEIFGVTVVKINRRQEEELCPPWPPFRRTAVRLEEGDRHPRSRPEDRTGRRELLRAVGSWP